jgi:hypothetical protein
VFSQTCGDCQYWKGESYTNILSTGECQLIGVGSQTEKAYLAGSKDAVLMTRSDFRCSEHTTRSDERGFGSVRLGGGK